MFYLQIQYKVNAVETLWLGSNSHNLHIYLDVFGLTYCKSIVLMSKRSSYHIII